MPTETLVSPNIRFVENGNDIGHGSITCFPCGCIMLSHDKYCGLERHNSCTEDHKPTEEG